MYEKPWKVLGTENGDEIALSKIPKTFLSGPRLSIVTDPEGSVTLTAEEALDLARRLVEWAMRTIAVPPHQRSKPATEETNG